MGGSSTEIEETAAEQAQAEVAASMWEMYQQLLAPYEDVFIANVREMNDPQAYTQAAGDAAMAYSTQFGDTRDETARSLVASGVNPNSGKFAGEQNNLTLQQAVSQNDAVNRSQSSQADQYTGGLQDALAIGSGQSAQNMQALDRLADAAGRSAAADARTAQADSLSDASLLGSLAGAAATTGLGLYRSNRQYS